MAWTLEKLLAQPENLNLPMRPVVSNVGDKGDRRDLVHAHYTYQVCYYTKGGVGAEGSAAIEKSQEASLGVTCDGSGGGANAYLLPWAKNKVYYSTLGQKHQFFFTAKLNSCGIFIAGGLCNPTVVHANAFDQINIPADTSAASMNNLIGQFKTIYEGMAEELFARGELDRENAFIFRPGVLGYTGDAAVFGVRPASRWSFYAVIGSAKNPSVHRIWPQS